MYHEFVLPNGNLNDQKVIRKEKLYQGLNDRLVERVFFENDRSYIFKSIKTKTPIKQELWVHQHILKDFPAIFPKIVAHHYSSNFDESWILMEDFGSIKHEYSRKLLAKVTNYIAWWHAFPTSKEELNTLQGQKPTIEDIQHSLINEKAMVIEIIKEIDWSEKDSNLFFQKVVHKTFEYKKVVSHGDLHLGNFGYTTNMDVVVIDWEHLHLNIPHWDLYFLIDSTHPEFPKMPDQTVREETLHNYLNTIQITDPSLRKTFIADYYRFSLIFSIWMLLLINKDLHEKETNWSKEQLKRQQKETIAVIEQCKKRVM